MNSKLFILILEGTTRPKRNSIHAAKFIEEVGKQIKDITVQLVDPAKYNFPFDGNDEENKDPRFTALTQKADAFFVVTPEYNHSFPGSLKRMLDSELKNYIHKPVAFAGVSNGQWGGVRAIESLVTSVREMGLVATFTDIQFPKVQEIFDENGNLKDNAYEGRIKRTYEELIWMAKALKYGRENISSQYHQSREKK